MRGKQCINFYDFGWIIESMQMPAQKPNSHIGYFVLFLVALVLGISLALLSGKVLAGAGITSPQYLEYADILITVAFGYAALKLLSDSIIEYGKRRPRIDERLLAKVVRIIGYVIIVLLVMSIFRIDLTGVLISAGFLGIVIGLAAQSTLGNLFAGISMMAAKPFANGDRVTFSSWQYGALPPSYAHRFLRLGFSGIIEEIDLMYTRLRQDDGTVLYVPNGVMNGAAIINYSVSDVIDVNFRLELPLEADFASFRSKVFKEIDRHSRLHKAIKGKPEVIITDIASQMYGVDVIARSEIRSEAYVKSEIAAIVLRIASKTMEGGK
ncbi:MAG: mechanosensitive ion channel family protein [Candidatus Micrarchaeota archaeon]|nr:mechanosensitive ion channel family protein [Candidatus Micrarchaeota archaeon]